MGTRSVRCSAIPFVSHEVRRMSKKRVIASPVPCFPRGCSHVSSNGCRVQRSPIEHRTCQVKRVLKGGHTPSRLHQNWAHDSGARSGGLQKKGCRERGALSKGDKILDSLPRRAMGVVGSRGSPAESLWVSTMSYPPAPRPRVTRSVGIHPHRQPESVPWVALHAAWSLWMCTIAPATCRKALCS
jgi:hypothetical protein